MEKVRPRCGQPWDLERLKTRTKEHPVKLTEHKQFQLTWGIMHAPSAITELLVIICIPPRPSWAAAELRFRHVRPYLRAYPGGSILRPACRRFLVFSVKCHLTSAGSLRRFRHFTCEWRTQLSPTCESPIHELRTIATVLRHAQELLLHKVLSASAALTARKRCRRRPSKLCHRTFVPRPSAPLPGRKTTVADICPQVRLGFSVFQFKWACCLG